MSSSEIVGYVTLTFTAQLDEETGLYVSRCRELGIASCGATIDHAFAMLAEAVGQYLAAIDEEGERDRVFRESGLRIVPEPPREFALGTAGIDEIVSPRAVAVPA